MYPAPWDTKHPRPNPLLQMIATQQDILRAVKDHRPTGHLWCCTCETNTVLYEVRDHLAEAHCTNPGCDYGTVFNVNDQHALTIPSSNYTFTPRA